MGYASWSREGLRRLKALNQAPNLSLAQLAEFYDRGFITTQDYDRLTAQRLMLVKSAPAPIVPSLAGKYIRQEQ